MLSESEPLTDKRAGTHTQEVLHRRRFNGLENTEYRFATNEGSDIEEAAYSQAGDRICAADC